MRSIVTSLLVWLTIGAHDAQSATQAKIVRAHSSVGIDPSDITIALERTVCLGSCPVYRLTITGLGDIEYHGSKYVKTLGVHKAKMHEDDVLKLVNALLRVRFFDAEDDYDGFDLISRHDGRLILGHVMTSDVTPTIVTLRLGKYKKSVRLNSISPHELGNIPQLIDEAVDIERWIGFPCERPRSFVGPHPQPGECDR